MKSVLIVSLLSRLDVIMLSTISLLQTRINHEVKARKSPLAKKTATAKPVPVMMSCALMKYSRRFDHVVIKWLIS